MKPRYYQTDAVNAIWDYLTEQQGNPLVALPTGTGKSLCIALFMELLLRQHSNARFMVLTHVKELISQNYDTLKRIWPTAPAGIYSAGLDRKDNTKGYELDNVVGCCGACNIIRGDRFSIEEMKLLGETVRKIKQNRVINLRPD